MVEQSTPGNAKLDKIRALMQEKGLTVFVCFHMDQHNSEYIAECDERIAFASGFTGSNGCCVVTLDDARMWTDGRYYLQAQKQLEAGWTMMKMERGEKMWFEWVTETIKDGKVGIDYTQYPSASVEARLKLFTGKGLALEHHANLVDTVWGADRPARPKNPVSILDMKYAGEEPLDKYNRLAERLDGMPLLVTTLDDIAWLLNCRGTDISYNPVFFSYVLFYPDTKTVSLYIDAEKVEPIKDYLAGINVTILPYEQIDADLTAMAAKEGSKVAIHANTCNAHLTNLVKDIKVVLDDNPI
jgi:Xaa-Pro aminopeptidase